MKTHAAAIGAAAVTLLAVIAVVAWVSMTRTSPGALHASHAEVAGLQGSGSCVACHAGSDGSMADACTQCHEAIAKQHEAKTGLHGTLDGISWEACGTCHAEHVGGAVPLVTELSFSQLGVDDPRDYHHDRVADFALEGAHDLLACEQCHPNAWAVSLEEGAPRFLDQTQDCVGCHEDPHLGELPACADCHGQTQPFPDTPGFEHTGFELVGGHKIADCRECHTEPSYKGAPTECASCHLDDYRTSPNLSHAGVGFDTDCAACHTVTEWAETSFAHAQSFPLEVGHAGLACNDCHTERAADLEPLRGGACAACHQSPHSKVFAAGISKMVGEGFDQACSRCHTGLDASFARPDARLTTAQHAATRFELLPPHDIQDCDACHDHGGQEPRWAQTYPGRRADECQRCHDDPHLGQFDSGTTRGRCLACHEPDHFTPTKFGIEMHSRCQFPLTGAHRAVSCQMCHHQTDERVVFVPTPASCAECHEDAHAGRFDGDRRIGKPEPAQGCDRCHDTTSFASVTWTPAEHQRWTGYALAGAHEQAACTRCHETDKARPVGERFLTPGTACSACHTDPHLGQFDQAGGADCARCHTESAFSELVFDHQRDSRFALDETHRSLACASCHRSYPTDQGDVVHYRPLGTECADCHAAQPKPNPGNE